MEPHYFVAITLPNYIKEVLSNYKEDMEEELPFRSWVHKEDYHITLSFLGSATEEQLEGIKNGLQTLIEKRNYLSHYKDFQHLAWKTGHVFFGRK